MLWWLHHRIIAAVSLFESSFLRIFISISIILILSISIPHHRIICIIISSQSIQDQQRIKSRIESASAANRISSTVKSNQDQQRIESRIESASAQAKSNRISISETRIESNQHRGYKNKGKFFIRLNSRSSSPSFSS